MRIRGARWYPPSSQRVQQFTAALLVLVAAVIAGLLPVAAEQPNGAGIVVRHGDGTLIYAYVQFDEESISGEELLSRSGLDLNLAPFSGLGVAVCSINGEGCSADDCFCQSYGNPSYYWHYYALAPDGWSGLLTGPSSRQLSDGDVDGWSWTASDSGLPATSIDEIAALNGIDRSPEDPTPSPTSVAPTSTPEPTETAIPDQPTSTLMPTTPTPLPGLPTETIEPTSTPVVIDEPTAPSLVLATTTARSSVTPPAMRSTPTPTSPTRTPTSTPEPRRTSATPTPVRAMEVETPPEIDRVLTPAVGATTRAVIIAPDGTPQPLEPFTPTSDAPAESYWIFAMMIGFVILIGGVVLVRNRWGGGA